MQIVYNKDFALLSLKSYGYFSIKAKHKASNNIVAKTFFNTFDTVNAEAAVNFLK